MTLITERIAKAELQLATEQYLEKLSKFATQFPAQYQNLSAVVYHEQDLTIDDALNVLQNLSEVIG